MADNNTDNSVDTVASSPAQGPGADLLAARLKQGISPEQAAQSLHLDRVIIERLEQDAYSELPPLTFVRGYLRSYCQLLGLSTEAVFAKLDALQLEDQGAQLTRSPHLTQAGRRLPRAAIRTPSLLSLIALLVVLLGAVAAGTWWLLSDAPDAPATAPVPTENAAEPNTPSDEGDSSDADNAIDSPPVPVDAPQDGEAFDPAEGVEQSTESVRTQPMPAERVDSAAAPALSTPNNAATGEVLELTIVGESWMEITDATGERLLFGLIGSGQRELVGEPPFAIVIGDIESVELEFQNTIVDLQPYARGNVARFSLGDT